eukprot:2684604-Rhodomonas_salina.1
MREDEGQRKGRRVCSEGAHSTGCGDVGLLGGGQRCRVWSATASGVEAVEAVAGWFSNPKLPN